MDGEGLYCSTAGEYFHSQESLHEHYRSAFHRYNLKRKVAGLPPVTREWFDERRAQLQAGTTTGARQVWLDPLSNKKFSSENTYLSFTRSKRYADLVRQSGAPAPAPVISLRRDAAPEDAEASAAPKGGEASAKAGFVVKPPTRPSLAGSEPGAGGAAEAEGGESDWETASDEEEGHWLDSSTPEWDECRSLFDNVVCESLEANLRRMYLANGFYIPDAEFCVDPRGLILYLGAKLSQARIPLYKSGLESSSKRFSSLHAVQRHMVDSNRCRMLYEDNEEEYEDWYDYGEDETGQEGDADAPPSSSQLVVVESLATDASALYGASASYELVLPRADGAGTRVLGCREFARYYRQRHRRGEEREGVAAARVVAQYRALALPAAAQSAPERLAARRLHSAQMRADQSRLRMAMRRNVNDNLPKNVPY